jgi:hypothetical protein
MSEQQKENTPERETMHDQPGESYRLVIKDNPEAERSLGGPHLIFRRKLEVDQNTVIGEEQGASDDAAVSDHEGASRSISDYISSLMNHVPDEVTRVVDAIIAEENRLPTNLPTLDENLSRIFPISSEEPGASESYETAGIHQDEEAEVETEPADRSVSEEADREDLPEYEQEDPLDASVNSTSKSQMYVKKVEYEDL